MRDRKFVRLVTSEVSDLCRVLTPDGQSLSSDFTIEELKSALQRLKPGKAAGSDSISPELILHVGSEIKSCLCEFLSSCLSNLKIPKIWRRAIAVAILKPTSPQGIQRAIDPSICCVSPSRSSSILPTPMPSPPLTRFSLESKLVPIWEINLRSSHFADSGHRRELFGEKKAGAVFVDLTEAYDIVWHHSLTCKLLHLLPDRYMVKMIMELVTNCSFTLTLGMEHTEGHDTSKMVFHGDQSWLPFHITSTPMTCRHQYHKNMHMQTILHLCILLETGKPSKGLLDMT